MKEVFTTTSRDYVSSKTFGNNSIDIPFCNHNLKHKNVKNRKAKNTQKKKEVEKMRTETENKKNSKLS